MNNIYIKITRIIKYFRYLDKSTWLNKSLLYLQLSGSTLLFYLLHLLNNKINSNCFVILPSPSLILFITTIISQLLIKLNIYINQSNKKLNQ